MISLRKHPLLLLSAVSAVVVVFHWCVLVQSGVFSVETYFVTVGILEKIEQVGLPTLRGSESGWPVPTTFGFLLAAAGWFAFYAAVLGAVMVAARILQPRWNEGRQ